MCAQIGAAFSIPQMAAAHARHAMAHTYTHTYTVNQYEKEHLIWLSVFFLK